MAQHNELGREGERKAADHLLAHGYRILERNWKAPRSRHELDIIAMEGECVVIVEVKTRSTDRFGRPLCAVDWRKVRALVSAADSYMRLRRIDLPVRYDLIGVVGDEIEHIKGAFQPPPRYYHC